MVDISAPQPRLAHATFPPRRATRTQSLPSAVADDTFYCAPRPLPLNSPPRLLSPYRLPEDAGLHKLSKPLCSPTKRRRGLARNLSRAARHRHCARTECCINTISGPPTSLDDLPWISALSIEPDYANPWDIADLSLLDIAIEEEPSSRGPGPVRRRKTPSRLHPLASPSKDDEVSPPVVAFPFVRRALFTQSDLTPQTPPPKIRFKPSEVTFHDLRPIFPSDLEEPPRSIDVDVSP
ncbi:hypothetical protein C8Q76DRAFT_104731 [Earliella scabrosa]|nr:hypothetical protein C8Q76DRAFT_104731 [Earliella scabrosa]